MRRGVAVIVFARAPIPGRAKTRLAARIGDWAAARLQAWLTERAMRVAREAGCGPVYLFATEGFFSSQDEKNPFFKRQKGADLGERMLRAFLGVLPRHRAAILIGTDCPALRVHDLRRAARALRGGYDAVLAPAEDGGYTLVGLRKASGFLFSGIDWGTKTVFSETMKGLHASGVRTRLLRTLWDVDRPEDLDRLRRLRLRRSS